MWHFAFFQRLSSVCPAWAARIHPRRFLSLPPRFLGFRFSGPVRTLPAVYVSAVIDVGSHPFPFRTRKLSRLSPMVLGLRARESRSLQDSRPACRKRRAGLFLYPRVTLTKVRVCITCQRCHSRLDRETPFPTRCHPDECKGQCYILEMLFRPPSQNNSFPDVILNSRRLRRIQGSWCQRFRAVNPGLDPSRPTVVQDDVK